MAVNAENPVISRTFKDLAINFKQLQLMRVRRDLSQRELAAQMQILGTNIDQQAISSIENNKRVVTDFELACFCKALCCTERELLQDYYKKYDL